MYSTTGNDFVKRLIMTAVQSHQPLKMATLGFCFACFTACSGKNDSSNATEQGRTNPTLSDNQAITLSKVALSTFPILPINIGEQTALYANAGQTPLPEGDLPFQSSSPAEILSLDTSIETAIQNCANSGIVNIQREPTQFHDNETHSSIETAISLEFVDCSSGNNTDLTAQDGAFSLTTSLEVDKQTSDTSADLLANFDNYNNTRISDTLSSTYWIDGEFGITGLSDLEQTRSTTMFAAQGTINNPDGLPPSSIKYDGFSLVLERSDQQQLAYIAGSIDATKGTEQFRYTLSTIEPMGIANGMVQGRFLLESDGSKIFLDRINTEEIMLSADYDGDGSIDYSTIITAPLDDFITAEHFLSLPL